MKNHIYENGKLLQTNKKFSQLKQAQKEKIYNWLKASYKESVLTKVPLKKQNDYVLDAVYEQIQSAEIWLPFNELEQFYYSKKARIRNKVLQELEGVSQ